MDELKVQSPGFGYQIAKDAAGSPIQTVYMTAQMRLHACRYGAILCLLDAHKCQFNRVLGGRHILPLLSKTMR
jgi:hypothetical protein